MNYRKRYSRNISLDQRMLPFKAVGRNGILAYALPWERRLVAGIVASLIALSVLYVYFVIASIVHVAAMQSLMGQVTDAKNAVSQLETSYFAKSDTITEQYAESLGYVAAGDTAFVSQNTALSLQ